MSKQLLHLVFGGKLTSVDSTEFVDLSQVEVVGFYPDYASAKNAWKGAAQRSVDHADVRFFVAHLHRLMDPSIEASAEEEKPSRISDDERLETLLNLIGVETFEEAVLKLSRGR